MATQIRHQDGITIIEPNGKIVGSKVLELRAALLSFIEVYDEPRILINFERVNRMSSSGLGALMHARTLTKHKKGRIGVIHIGKHIRNLLVLSRLSSFFEHFENEEAAVSAFSAWY